MKEREKKGGEKIKPLPHHHEKKWRRRSRVVITL